MSRWVSRFYWLTRLFGIVSLFLTILALTQLTTVRATNADWMQFGFDPQHSANNPLETTINAGNVVGLKKLFQVQLPANTVPPNITNIADDAPVYLSNVMVGGSSRDLLFVTTKPGDIVALDARTGQQIWRHQNGVANCLDSTPAPCFTTASPAIDPNRQFVYSYGVEGKVHKYHVETGEETLTGGWPELATLKPTLEKGSSSMAIGGQVPNGIYLYVASAGFLGDRGDYQGHLTTINLATGAQTVFNTLCSNQTVHLTTQPDTPGCSASQAAIWARAGAVYDADTEKVYEATGNGPYDPPSFNWGDSILALHPDGTGAGGGQPLDSYTPTNQQQLDESDTDLGSAAPVILPVINGRHLGAQIGKDHVLRLIDLDNLSGQGGPGHLAGEIASIPLPQGGQVLPQPAVWRNAKDNRVWLFVGNGRGISGLALQSSGNAWDSANTWSKTDHPCSSPIVANRVLYCAGPNYLRALNPTTGNELWHDTGIGGIHWESPIVVNGVLYISDENGQMTAYSLPIS